jgi:protein-S-isoprenylcysteine O-methyltransferase Ste14
MVKIGNFFFHYRNFLFPFFYAAMFIPSTPITTEYYKVAIIGGVIGLLGTLTRMGTIGLAYIIRGGKNRRVYAEDLVTDGLYAHCRNPMYIGNVLMIAGTGILSNSLFFVSIGIPFFIFIWQAIIRAEEDYLYNKFGEGFKDYMRDVNRWIPKFKGLVTTISRMEFKWKRVILKEYNTTWYWLIGCTLLVMIQVHKYTPELAVEYQYVFIGLIALFTLMWLGIKIMKRKNIITAD